MMNSSYRDQLQSRNQNWRQDSGRQGEELACQVYLKSGALLLARNYRLKCGEIDLIFEEKEGPQPTLVFVEVRARSPSACWETPAESLTPRKIRRLRNAASRFLMEYRGAATSVRFDLASWDFHTLSVHKNFWWY